MFVPVSCRGCPLLFQSTIHTPRGIRLVRICLHRDVSEEHHLLMISGEPCPGRELEEAMIRKEKE